MNQNNGELHLMIIWERGRYEQEKIIADLLTKLAVVDCYEVEWSSDLVASNFTRFYGVNLPDGSFKEEECGRGKFLLLLLKDQSPLYETRATSRGDELVNSKLFDAKTLYRSWTGGGHKIHATNTPQETNHDLTLLLGVSYDDYLKNAPTEWDGQIKAIKRDLLGACGWNALDEFFYALNNTLKYVTLRNFEYLPDSYKSEEHGDIDLLVENFDNARYVANAKKVFEEPHRVHCECRIGGEPVRFDFRHVGDNYYCEQWERDILANRVFDRGFYVPSKEDYKYSLLYHAIVQKPKLSAEYKKKLSEFFELIHINVLENFMDARGYNFVEPEDASVYYLFRQKASGRVVVRRKSNASRIEVTPPIYTDVLDLSCYPGEDLYSDGDIEDEILNFVSDNPPSAYEAFIESRRDWAVAYHLSPLRQNILAGVGISKDDEVLEIGSGMGAITGKLCRLAKNVTCVELSKKRSQINALRNGSCGNLKIYVGDFQTVESRLEKKFDAATLIGVFEYASSYIKVQKPYHQFLAIAMNRLKQGGRLYIAIENRLGLKYFAGCKEDHVGMVFEGIEGYSNTNRAKTFSREELEILFAECGIKNYRFMYPYPDYKFPKHIYGDEWLPKKGELTMNLMNMDQSRYIFFDETKAYDSIAGTKYFATFANSFLIGIVKE